MECRKIQPLISLYIEGDVDYNTCHTIEEHLKTCRHCEEKYISMTKMMTILRSFEKIQAPADFLNKFHEKIELVSWKNRLRKLLYIPKHIKYPLDIIALGTTAILVFVVFSMLQVQKQEDTNTSIGSMLSRSEQKHQEPTAGINEPIQMALFLIPEASEITDATQQREGHNLDENRPVIIDNKNIYRVDSGRYNSEESVRLPEISQKSKSEVNDLLNDLTHPLQTEAAQRYFTNKAVSEINHNLIIEEGKIISFENIPETDQPEFVNIQIPESNYDSFLERLVDMGRLEISSLSKPVDTKQIARIRIQIIPPQYPNQRPDF